MKTNKLLIPLLMVLVLVGFANALQVTSPIIGGANQDRLDVVSATFTITNNDTFKVENITIQHNADSQYNIAFTNAPSELLPGASATVTVKGKVPLDFDAIDRTTLSELAKKIGTITVQGINPSVPAASGIISETADLKMQAVNQLRIDKVRVACGSKSKTLDDGEEMTALKPDTSCTITVEVENNFRSKDTNDQKIGDIDMEVTVTVESDDSDVDLDDDDSDNLDANDNIDFSFDFDIDEEADDKTYNIEVRAYSVDDNGAYHGEIWTVQLEVEREKHELAIKKIIVMPSIIESCKDMSNMVTISTQIANTGRRDESEAAVELSLPDFKFIEKKEDIELDRDDSTTLSFQVTIPENIKPGKYRGTLKTFFDNLGESMTETVEVEVLACSITQDEPEEEEQTTTIIIPESNDQEKETSKIPAMNPPIIQKETSFTESAGYTILLVGLVVLLTIIIVGLAIVFLGKKRK